MRKAANLHGLQHRDHQGNIIPARTTGSPCNCREKCIEKVEPELQFHVITTFNNMNCKEQQDQYLSGLTVAADPLRIGAQGSGGKYGKENKGRRQASYKYYIATGTVIPHVFRHRASPGYLFFVFVA